LCGEELAPLPHLRAVRRIIPGWIDVEAVLCEQLENFGAQVALLGLEDAIERARVDTRRCRLWRYCFDSFFAEDAAHGFFTDNAERILEQLERAAVQRRTPRHCNGRPARELDAKI